jgi:hypothetical protein
VNLRTTNERPRAVGARGRLAAAAELLQRRAVEAGLTLEDLLAEWEAQEHDPAWQHNPDPNLHPDTRALLDEVERMRLDLRARLIRSITAEEDT